MKPTLPPSVLRSRVCILIPVCNEAEGIAELRRKLEDLQRSLEPTYSVEYCIVDDGSTDATPAQLCEAAPSGAACAVLSHTTNCGLGAAFRTGFAHTQADIVCTIDADCSYAPRELCRLIELVDCGAADIAVASPYHPEGCVEDVQPWRLALSLRCSGLYRVASPLKLHTYTSMCRAYRGSILAGLRFPSNGFVSTVEILLSAAAQGYRVREVPATLRSRKTGSSKMRLARTIRTHLKLLGRCARARIAGRYPELPAPRPEAVARLLPMYVRKAGDAWLPAAPAWAGQRSGVATPIVREAAETVRLAARA